MHFVMDLFRRLIFPIFAIAVIGMALAMITLLSDNDAAGVTPLASALLLSVSALLALFVGSVAVLISMHDHNADVVIQLTRLADLAENGAAARRQHEQEL